METRIAVLADYASYSHDGKLNIMGIFTDINASKVPAVHPEMKLVFQLEFDSSEVGEKQLKIVMIDEDGNELFSISGMLNVQRERNLRTIRIPRVLSITNLQIPKFGEYEFKILVNGAGVSTIPLTVTKITAPPAEN